MKIIEYNIIDEANQDLLKHIANIDSRIAGLGGKNIVKPKDVVNSDEDGKDEYRYNTNKITFILKSSDGYNKFDSRSVTATYGFFDNVLHIFSNSSRNQLKIYFDYTSELKELNKNVQYKVDRIEGRFQNVIGKEAFDTFILLSPDKILKSVKINTTNGENPSKNTINDFKPNANVDFTINHKGKSIDIKGLAHLEAQIGGNKYKFTNGSMNFILTTDKPLINRSNIKYVLKRMSGKDNDNSFDIYDAELIVKSLKYL